MCVCILCRGGEGVCVCVCVRVHKLMTGVDTYCVDRQSVAVLWLGERAVKPWLHGPNVCVT